MVAHQWLTEWFQPVVQAVPAELRGKREAAQIYHELLDYRWYASLREFREVPLLEAVHGYIRDVLRALPDEVIAAAAPAEERQWPTRTTVPGLRRRRGRAAPARPVGDRRAADRAAGSSTSTP